MATAANDPNYHQWRGRKYDAEVRLLIIEAAGNTDEYDMRTMILHGSAVDPHRASENDLSAALRHWQRSGEAGVVLIAE